MRTEERLQEEKKIVRENGYTEYIDLYKLITDHARTVRKPLLVKGRINYSYLAYTLGITAVNPTERDYPMKMAFGYHMDRIPDMSLGIPLSYDKPLTEYLESQFGKEHVTRDESSIKVGDIKLHVFISDLLDAVDSGIPDLSSVDISDGRLLRALGRIHGRGIGDHARFFTRDDIYRYVLGLGADAKTAYNIMEYARKGQGSDSRTQTLLSELGAGPEEIEQIGKIKYMAWEADLIPEAKLMSYILGTV